MNDDKFVSPCPRPNDHQREVAEILIEECAEVQQRATKMLRFGVEEVQYGQTLTNAQRLGAEVGDVLETIDLALNAGIIDQASIDRGRDSKKRQLAKYMQTEPQDIAKPAGNLFVNGDFTAHSGNKLYWKIECDALTDGDIDTLAAEIARRFRFRGVYGVPRGGLRLQKALEPYIGQDGGLLIVDDVLTTGRSMEEVRARIGDTETQGVVIFARGICPDWINPLFYTIMGESNDRR